MKRVLLMVGVSLLLLVACAGAAEEPSVIDSELGDTPEPPALSPAENETPGDTETEDEPGQTPTSDEETEPVVPVTVDLGELTPLPPTDGTPVEMPAPGIPSRHNELIQTLMTDVSQRTDVAADDVRLVQLEEVEWSDSSLGCPEPGANYLQVITPGLRIVLEADEQNYEYHTDLDGRFVLCEEGDPRPPMESPTIES